MQWLVHVLNRASEEGVVLPFTRGEIILYLDRTFSKAVMTCLPVNSQDIISESIRVGSSHFFA